MVPSKFTSVVKVCADEAIAAVTKSRAATRALFENPSFFILFISPPSRWADVRDTHGGRRFYICPGAATTRGRIGRGPVNRTAKTRGNSTMVSFCWSSQNIDLHQGRKSATAKKKSGFHPRWEIVRQRPTSLHFPHRFPALIEAAAIAPVPWASCSIAENADRIWKPLEERECCAVGPKVKLWTSVYHLKLESVTLKESQ